MALSTLLEDAELAAPLAAVLAYACKTGTISYSEVTEIAGVNPEETLLSGNRWRLLMENNLKINLASLKHRS
jgi:hypothetical protein